MTIVIEANVLFKKPEPFGFMLAGIPPQQTLVSKPIAMAMALRTSALTLRETWGSAIAYSHSSRGTRACFKTLRQQQLRATTREPDSELEV
jgi:hypothetical protein